MHFITKVSTMTSMIIIMKDWLREYRSKVQKVLFTRRKLFPKTKKKTEVRKAVCLFCDNEDQKDKLNDAGEYHLGSNNLNTKHAESITENWKQTAMDMQLGGLHV